ncbi:hypothetical protein Sjap_022030 [Stephania japonica]|uniref:Lipoxygenase domain-containing protein n=1 Tax=Stephania japonica TaxID=461633 RepID=A0AAP0EVB5_9MAGN
MEASWEDSPVIKGKPSSGSKGGMMELSRIIDRRNLDEGLLNRSGAGVVPHELLKPRWSRQLVESLLFPLPPPRCLNRLHYRVVLTVACSMYSRQAWTRLGWAGGPTMTKVVPQTTSILLSDASRNVVHASLRDSGLCVSWCLGRVCMFGVKLGLGEA